MESVGFCVRVSAIEGYGSKIIALIGNADYTHLIAVKHTGNKDENPHYHIVIRTAVKADAFRKRMKVVFNEGRGNGHMSIVPWDGHDYALSYLFHEEADTPLVAIKGLLQEDIDRYKQINKDVQVAVQAAKGRSSHTLADLAYHEFRETQINGQYDIWRTRIGEWIVGYALRSGKYMPQPWLLKAMVTQVMYRLMRGNVSDEENFIGMLVGEIYQR